MLVTSLLAIIKRNKATESPKDAVLVRQADMSQQGNIGSNGLTFTTGFGTVDRVAQNKTACTCHVNDG